MPSIRYVLCTTLLASSWAHIFASSLSTEKTTYAEQIEQLASDQLETHPRNRLEAAYPHRLLPLGVLSSRHDLKDNYAREFDKRQTDNTTLVPTDIDSPTTTALTSSSFFSSSSMVAETTSDAPVTTTSTTLTTSSSPPNDLPPPQSSTQTGILIPVTVTTTNSAGQTETQTMPIFQSSASVSVVQPITTTDNQGQASTGTATIPGVVVTNINSVGQTVISTLPVSMATVIGGSLVDTAAVRTTIDNAGDTVVFSATSSGQVVSATKQGGVVVVITFTPSPVYLSEIVYKTTRLANGQQMTITTLEIVGQAAPTSTAGSGQAGTPKLATDVAARLMARDAGCLALFMGGLLCLIVMI